MLFFLFCISGLYNLNKIVITFILLCISIVKSLKDLNSSKKFFWFQQRKKVCVVFETVWILILWMCCVIKYSPISCLVWKKTKFNPLQKKFTCTCTMYTIAVQLGNMPFQLIVLCKNALFLTVIPRLHCHLKWWQHGISMTQWLGAISSRSVNMTKAWHFLTCPCKRYRAKSMLQPCCAQYWSEFFFFSIIFYALSKGYTK